MSDEDKVIRVAWSDGLHPSDSGADKFVVSRVDIQAAEARRADASKELYDALKQIDSLKATFDAIETNARFGNGNVWRFWADQARDYANRMEELREELREAKQEIARLQGAGRARNQDG